MLMMAIYVAKYVVGATTALDPRTAGSTGFVVILSVIFGCLSGAFFARFLRIWSHRSNPVETVRPPGIEAMGTRT
jgi:hypothetical protein